MDFEANAMSTFVIFCARIWEFRWPLQDTRACLSVFSHLDKLRVKTLRSLRHCPVPPVPRATSVPSLRQCFKGSKYSPGKMSAIHLAREQIGAIMHAYKVPTKCQWYANQSESVHLLQHRQHNRAAPQNSLCLLSSWSLAWRSDISFDDASTSCCVPIFIWSIAPRLVAI